MQVAMHRLFDVGKRNAIVVAHGPLNLAERTLAIAHFDHVLGNVVKSGPGSVDVNADHASV